MCGPWSLFAIKAATISIVSIHMHCAFFFISLVQPAYFLSIQPKLSVRSGKKNRRQQNASNFIIHVQTVRFFSPLVHFNGMLGLVLTQANPKCTSRECVEHHFYNYTLSFENFKYKTITCTKHWIDTIAPTHIAHRIACFDNSAFDRRGTVLVANDRWLTLTTQRRSFSSKHRWSLSLWMRIKSDHRIATNRKNC